MMTPLIGKTLAAALVLAAIPSRASPPAAPIVNGRPTAIVRIHGIDLATERGRRRLTRRIADAVEAACGSYFGAGVEEQDAIARCRGHAMADISPRIAALLARRGRPAAETGPSRTA